MPPTSSKCVLLFPEEEYIFFGSELYNKRKDATNATDLTEPTDPYQTLCKYTQVCTLHTEIYIQTRTY